MAAMAAMQKVPLTVPAVAVGLRWDILGERVDLDGSAVVFDSMGVVMDCCYFNQLQIMGGAISHSGDEKTGAREGDDESILVQLASLPPSACAIFFIVNCHKGGTFQDVETAVARLVDPATHAELATFSLGCQGKHTAVLLAVVYREGPQWTAMSIGTPGEGRNFQESMPLIEKHLSSVFDAVLLAERPRDRTRTFNLDKGETYLLDPEVTSIEMGLGWDAGCDLDGSVAVFDAQHNHLEDIFFGRQSGLDGAVVHSGDNVTGEGAGDDERIKVRFALVPPNVHTLFFVVCIYTSGTTFAKVRQAYCRMLDTTQGDHELCRFQLGSDLKKNAVIMASVTRAGGMWRMRALGVEASGRTVRDLHSVLAEEADPTIRERRAKERQVSEMQRAQRAAEQAERSRQERILWNVRLRVMAGHNLAVKDAGGSSDPYLKVKYHGSKQKTPVIKKSLNPEWNHTMEFKIRWIDREHESLTCQVFDWDRFSKNDFMGEFRIPLSTIISVEERGKTQGEATFSLASRPGHSDAVSGDVTVSWVAECVVFA